jgi:hypothetical protein
MMSSVIPARLQFQCGHAAMVTLPRVKGESAAQRNDRVAREKSAALARQCDFCAPAVVVALNGNNHVADAPEPVVQLETPVADTLVVVETPVLEDAAPVETASEAPVVELAVAAVPMEDVEVEDVEAAVELLEEAVQVLEAADVVVTLEPVDVVEVVEVAEAAAPLNGTATTAAPVRRARRSVAPKKQQRAEEIARGRRFLVEYRVERVLHAVDIHDALRQAASLGASKLTAITREH